MGQFNRVIPSAIREDILSSIDRKGNWCFNYIFARKERYGYLVVTVDDDFRDEDEEYGDWNDDPPKAIGEAFAFDPTGNLLGQREWRSASEPSAIDRAVATTADELARELLHQDSASKDRGPRLRIVTRLN